MSTHNIDFPGDLTKNIFKLSSNTHIISSSGASCSKLTMSLVSVLLKFKMLILRGPIDKFAELFYY